MTDIVVTASKPAEIELFPVRGSSAEVFADSVHRETVSSIHYDTTANWNAQPRLVALPGHIYVYTDYMVVNGVTIPGIKIGDGTAYLIDLPFVAGNTNVATGVYVNTTDGWNSQPALISVANQIYVYSDYSSVDGHECPGIKIGDGLSYLIDIPFVVGNTQALNDHISDTNVHITNAERAFWNDKVTCFLSSGDAENLVFTKN